MHKIQPKLMLMSNQQTSVNRRTAIIVGLFLHLSLGVALYYHLGDRPTAAAKHSEMKHVSVKTPALP
jgi:hypothetical protein